MRYTTALALFAASASAYPGLMGSSKEALLETMRQAELEKREPQPGGILSTLGSVLTPLASTIEGVLGSVAENVNPSDKRPEPGYTFQAPGPNDSRGPCPGLNLLANYGLVLRESLPQLT